MTGGVAMAKSGREVIIVGGSAAGLRCACRLARLQPQWKIHVIEQREVFAYSVCGLPYVLSGDVESLETLRTTDYLAVRDEAYFASYKGVKISPGTRALDIDVDRRILHVDGARGASELHWDDLVLATGASPVRLPGQPADPRVVSFHTWNDVVPLKQALMRGELGSVAIVGAGATGCELAEAFRSLWGAEVTVLEAAAAPLPGILDEDLGAAVASHLQGKGVRTLLGARVDRIETRESGVALHVGAEVVEADTAVVALGVRPAVELARRAGVQLGTSGAIAVDERMATSLSHVWAVGDCAEVRDAVSGETTWMPLGALGNRQGRTLANVLSGRDDAFPPAAGAVVVKIFDLNVAATGHTESAGREHGVPLRSIWITTFDRAHYWPESHEIHLKLVYDPATRRVLGVQAVSEGDVLRSVDVATQMIVRRSTLEDFARVEHAHAPPFSPPIDPLVVAAFAAQNQEDGLEAVSPLEPIGDQVVLDVRTRADADSDPVAGGRVNVVPLGELRERLDEIDEATSVVVCGRGTRSSEAARLLQQRSIGARYIGGGLRWRGQMSGPQNT
jgi:NADPH-dependent 2,4-dienoyl-CoA reductase/sulfur reductase-like enzyme/rhodanese-related sulfurtransferase